MGTDVVDAAHGKSVTCVVRRMSDETFIATYKAEVVNGEDDTDKLIEHIASFYKDIEIIKDVHKHPIAPVSMKYPTPLNKRMDSSKIMLDKDRRRHLEELKKYFRA